MTEWTNEQLVFITTAYFSEGRTMFQKTVYDEIISIQENHPAVHQIFHKFWKS